MAKYYRLKGGSRLSDKSKLKAERFREMLLEHHGLQGNDKKEFEAIVNGLQDYQLVNLSRQYAKSVITYLDSDGSATIIGQDLLNRIRKNGQATLGNAIREIQYGKTDANYKVVQAIQKYEKTHQDPGDMQWDDLTVQEKIETIGYVPGEWDE